MNIREGISVRENVPLSNKNTYCIGGDARYYYMPKGDDDLRMVMEFADNCGYPVFMLGKGSNVLISDAGWPGIVVQLPTQNSEKTMIWQGNKVEVCAGMPLNALVKEVADHGYVGLEELAGIPGTVGGAVIMNAGAFSSCIADTLIEATCLMRKTGKTETINSTDMSMGYRNSSIKESGNVVVRATFSFSGSDHPDRIHSIRKDILERRKEKQPYEYPNCGSVFKRPVGNFAGTLIEKCGLKGLRCGGAEVSEKHANFIVNTGAATAADVRHLICTIQQRVYDAYGVLLEPEVIFMGDFDEALFLP